MDSSQIPSFEIPKSAESTPIYAGGEETDPGLNVEGTREILPAPHTALQQPTASSPAQGTIPPVIASPVSPVVALSNDSHIIADDVDVIEKEWVERAKKIISMTADDPYTGSKEIGKLKATYMKKRFNKDLPLTDDEVN